MRTLLILALAAGLAGCAPGGRVVLSTLKPQPFCRRTLGTAECFANPEALPDRPSGLADTPVRTHTECVAWWQDGGLICRLRQPGRL